MVQIAVTMAVRLAIQASKTRGLPRSPLSKSLTFRSQAHGEGVCASRRHISRSAPPGSHRSPTHSARNLLAGIRSVSEPKSYAFKFERFVLPISNYHPLVIPGLLQTEEHTLAFRTDSLGITASPPKPLPRAGRDAERACPVPLGSLRVRPRPLSSASRGDLRYSGQDRDGLPPAVPPLGPRGTRPQGRGASREGLPEPGLSSDGRRGLA